MKGAAQGHALLRLGLINASALQKRAQVWGEKRQQRFDTALGECAGAMSLLMRAVEDAALYILAGTALVTLVVGVSVFTMVVVFLSSAAFFLESRGCRVIASVRAMALEVAWVFGAGKTSDGHYIRSWLFEFTDRPASSDRVLISFEDEQRATDFVSVPLGISHGEGSGQESSRILPHLATAGRKNNCSGVSSHGVCAQATEADDDDYAAENVLCRNGHVRYCLVRPAQSHPKPRGLVVLLHGVSMTCDIWSPYIGALSEAGWSVLAYDMWGHGDTAVPADMSLRPDVFAQQLESLLQVLQVRRRVKLSMKK
jgi:hypothetical protein